MLLQSDQLRKIAAQALKIDGERVTFDLDRDRPIQDVPEYLETWGFSMGFKILSFKIDGKDAGVKEWVDFIGLLRPRRGVILDMSQMPRF